MKRFRAAILAVCIGLIYLPLLAKDPAVSSRWTAAPVPVDADRAKWEPESLTRQKSVDIDYAFKNDAANLYGLLVFNDPKYLSSITTTGITIWVDTAGKDARTSGLHLYQKAVTPDGLIAFLESRGDVLTDEKKQEIKTKRQYIIYACDLVDKKGRVIAHPGPDKGLFRSAKDGKTTIYEFLLPLSLLRAAAGEGQWDTGKPLTLGFEWGGMTDEMRRARAARIGESGSRASEENSDIRGSIGAETDNAGARAPSASLEGMLRGPKKHDFWLELTLAQQK